MTGPRQERYQEPSEERRTAAIKSIESKGVRVMERLPNNEKAHHNVLENVGAGLAESIKCGVPLPKSVMFELEFAEREGDAVNIPGAYRNSDDAILINPNSRFFQAGMLRAKAFVEHAYDSREFSTNSLFHVIRHELSHCVHWHHDHQSYGLDYFEDPSDEEMASQVSGYAGEDPRNFVAEVRAALLDGKDFSDEIMKLYSHYSGGLTR